MKFLVYNGRFSVGGLNTQAVSQDQNETLSFKRKGKRKKRIKTESKPCGFRKQKSPPEELSQPI